ncbi:acylneuraminate cytidylyltransferase family protein [Limnospira platensis]|uniref:acylneuraminate cytidylyltransferase family protein n=1 Tax=Limnospira platensis TaxID=118562 RepID=UPI0018C8C8CB
MDKNILEVLGKPLLQYTAEAARKSELINGYYVSSDDERILNAAEQVGYQRIKRPAELATPTSKHFDVIKHALKIIQDREVAEPDILIVQLANTVTVKTKWIDDCINEIIRNQDISAVVPTVINQDHHPYRMKKLDENGFLKPYFDFQGQSISTNRQELPPNYILCHNFWVLNVNKSVYSEDGDQPWSFMGSKVKPYVIDEAFDVHDLEDLIRSENWIKDNIYSEEMSVKK